LAASGQPARSIEVLAAIRPMLDVGSLGDDQFDRFSVEVASFEPE
jgi:hypothetical protein